MARIDYVLCGLYVAAVLWIGWRMRSGSGQLRSFYQAGGTLGWIPVGLSVMVSLFSSLNFVAYTGEVAGYGLYVLASVPVFVLVIWPVSHVAIPLFRRLGAINGYEYLERRYDARVRRLASMVYLFWRMFWMAAALLACGRLVSQLTGWPGWSVILLVAVVTTTYSAMGGLGAVIWTDVMQFGVILGGSCLAAWSGLNGQGGLWATLQACEASGAFRPVSPPDGRFWSLDPFERITIWSAVIGTFVAFLARYGADQMVFQRFMAARSLRQARLGFALNIGAMLVMLVLLTLLGLVAAAHAHTHGLGSAPGVAKVSHLLASLPAGFRGALVAGLLAATMSSVDSGLNACGSIWSGEVGRPEANGPLADEEASGTGRWQTAWLTVWMGAIVVVLSFAVGRLGTLFEIINRVVNGMGSPLLALMLLGLFWRRTTAFGMFWGGLTGTVLSVAVSFGVAGLALHLYAVLNLLLTLGACVALSRWGPAATEAQLSWTWSGLSRQAEGTQGKPAAQR